MLKKRGNVILAVFFILFLCLMIRLLYFQVGVGGRLSEAASAQRLKDSQIDKIRGGIQDRNGITFTNRSKRYIIALKPLLLRSNENDLKKLCDILQIDFDTTRYKIEANMLPILFETDIRARNEVLNLDIEGVSVINSLKRYDQRSIAKHVLGYLNLVDKVGEAGIEKYYNDVLNNKRENTIGVITDARNNLVQGVGYRIIKAERTKKELNVKLTLDYHIQKIVEEVMDRNNITGAVVVEDICNGDVIAMASKPDFNPNDLVGYLNSPEKELFNRAVASYNLGSIFKIIDAALIFEAGSDVEEEYFCNGFIKIGNKEFKCASYNKGGHGLISINEAFALSCNTYFINAGLKLGYVNIIEMARKFGIGSAAGIYKQGVDEAAGNLPDVNKYYSDGDIANISIGQGEIMSTPLQVADIVATVANGGIKNTVNIVDSIVDNDGNKVRSIKINEGIRIISKDTADKIKLLMETVTESGTGVEANLDHYGGAGGKTGSAETSKQGVVHAWFAGYFPKRTPKYSVAVFVENGQSGGKTAAPVFAEIAREIMRKGL